MKSLGMLFSIFSTSLQRRNLKVLLVLLAVFAVLVGAFSTTFHVLMEREGQSHSWPTAIYWTLVTMTTLGFGDITFQSDMGRIFSVVVLLSGTVFLLVLLPFTFIQFVVAPWMALRDAARAPHRLPADERDHLILTSYGHIEESLIELARNSGVSYAVLVPDVDAALALHDRSVRVMVGDLDDPQTYRNARVEHAAVVAATGPDVTNTNTTFTVREVAPRVPVIATVSSTAAVDVLQLAGADVVLRLAQMLGGALAERALAPGAKAHRVGSFAGVEIAEVAAAGTPLAGHSLAELELRRRYGVSLVGLWDHGHFEVARAETVVAPTSVILLAGTMEQLAAIDRLTGGHAQTSNMIVIGGGRVGRAAGRTFAAAGLPYRIIEQQPDRVRDPDVYVVGDASDLAVLERAGLDTAGGVVITTHDDDVNVYLTIYCQRLRPDLRIVARANSDRNVSTLYRAGADAVMSYGQMGAVEIWNHVSDDDTLIVTQGLSVFRRSVPRNLVGTTLVTSNLRRRTGCSVVAVGREGAMETNPDPHRRFAAGEVIVLAGDANAEERFAAAFPRSKR